MSAATAQELRRAFDRIFAEPPLANGEDAEPLVLLSAGGEPLALHCAEISGLYPAGRWVRVPSQAPELLGVAGIRGGLVPVFDLAAVLSLSAPVACRWLAVTRGATPLALAFDRLEGQAAVARTALETPPPALARRHVRQVARLQPAARAIVDVRSVLEALRRPANFSIPPGKE